MRTKLKTYTIRIYDGNVYEYGALNEYRVVLADSKDLLIENGFELLVDYYDSSYNEIPSIKDAGSYYVKLKYSETYSLNQHLESLFIINYKTNYRH